ncbi:Ribosomal RNA large subunit methyltransferase H [Paenibacillus sp. P1XP2]|nr:Ribosomal RNA large subunit methyltransferase H [Paenibacillus sp. P1XP2]
MLIQIIGVGKLKEKYLMQGIQEYAKRLTPYIKFQVIEVADEKAPDTLSEAEVSIVKEREGERILAQVKESAHVIALAIGGQLWSSEELPPNSTGSAPTGRAMSCSSSAGASGSPMRYSAVRSSGCRSGA